MLVLVRVVPVMPIKLFLILASIVRRVEMGRVKCISLLFLYYSKNKLVDVARINNRKKGNLTPYLERQLLRHFIIWIIKSRL